MCIKQQKRQNLMQVPSLRIEQRLCNIYSNTYVVSCNIIYTILTGFDKIYYINAIRHVMTGSIN